MPGEDDPPHGAGCAEGVGMPTACFANVVVVVVVVVFPLMCLASHAAMLGSTSLYYTSGCRSGHAMVPFGLSCFIVGHIEAE